MANTRRIRDLLLASVGLLLVGRAGADVNLSILPALTTADPGDTVVVELTIVDEGSAFNAYDARVTYDPQRLLFLRTNPSSLQEGPLMTGACPQRFHIFTIAPDSTWLQVNHSLLCAGATVTGPGVVYRLRFQCRGVEGQTALGFDPAHTDFYNDGLFVRPAHLTGAEVQIGGFTATPAAPPAGLRLNAAPNPFNPRTTVAFATRTDGLARLTLVDPAGRAVRTLLRTLLPAGEHEADWDGQNDAGLAAPSGVYFAVLEADGERVMRKVTLIR